MSIFASAVTLPWAVSRALDPSVTAAFAIFTLIRFRLSGSTESRPPKCLTRATSAMSRPVSILAFTLILAASAAQNRSCSMSPTLTPALKSSNAALSESEPCEDSARKLRASMLLLMLMVLALMSTFIIGASMAGK